MSFTLKSDIHTIQYLTSKTDKASWNNIQTSFEGRTVKAVQTRLLGKGGWLSLSILNCSPVFPPLAEEENISFPAFSLLFDLASMLSLNLVKLVVLLWPLHRIIYGFNDHLSSFSAAVFQAYIIPPKLGSLLPKLNEKSQT